MPITRLRDKRIVKEDREITFGQFGRVIEGAQKTIASGDAAKAARQCRGSLVSSKDAKLVSTYSDARL